LDNIPLRPTSLDIISHSFLVMLVFLERDNVYGWELNLWLWEHLVVLFGVDVEAALLADPLRRVILLVMYENHFVLDYSILENESLSTALLALDLSLK